MANIRVDSARQEATQREGESPLRNWGFRKRYPTGLKKTGQFVIECSRCHKVYGKNGVPLPKIREDKTLEPCINMVNKRRCMSEEYHMDEILEVEAMPIGRVRLPTKGKEW